MPGMFLKMRSSSSLILLSLATTFSFLASSEELDVRCSQNRTEDASVAVANLAFPYIEKACGEIDASNGAVATYQAPHYVFYGGPEGGNLDLCIQAFREILDTCVNARPFYGGQVHHLQTGQTYNMSKSCGVYDEIQSDGCGNEELIMSQIPVPSPPPGPAAYNPNHPTHQPSQLSQETFPAYPATEKPEPTDLSFDQYTHAGQPLPDGPVQTEGYPAKEIPELAYKAPPPCSRPGQILRPQKPVPTEPASIEEYTAPGNPKSTDQPGQILRPQKPVPKGPASIEEYTAPGNPDPTHQPDESAHEPTVPSDEVTKAITQLGYSAAKQSGFTTLPHAPVVPGDKPTATAEPSGATSASPDDDEDEGDSLFDPEAKTAVCDERPPNMLATEAGHANSNHIEAGQVNSNHAQLIDEGLRLFCGLEHITAGTLSFDDREYVYDHTIDRNTDIQVERGFRIRFEISRDPRKECENYKTPVLKGTPNDPDGLCEEVFKHETDKCKNHDAASRYHNFSTYHKCLRWSWSAIGRGPSYAPPPVDRRGV